MTRDFPFVAVGFDLDGTLLDSVGDLAAATNHALGVAGYAPLAVEVLRPMIGGGARQLLQSALTSIRATEDVDRLLPHLLDHYDAHMTDLTRPFPGVVEALDDLAVRGVTLAIVTNKRERFTLKLLEAFDLRDRFACVIGGDTIPGKAKPDPAPIAEMVRQCGGPAAFVGDSAYDVQAAKAAGVPCLVFAPAGDNTAGGDATFDRYAVLIAALEGLT